MSTKVLGSVGLLIAFIAAAACATVPPVADTGAIEASFVAGTNAWLDAYNAGDADKIVAMYANDAVVMPPNAPVCTGRDELRAYITSDMAASKAAGIVLVNGPSTTGATGDLGWHQGIYTVKAASGETIGSGSYMEVWRKIDGTWVIVRDIWNSDRPSTPPTPSS
jgi:ketosteroid isomerase-like protein